ncbi:MAG: hypothetical protein JO352_26290 [Chloroflexi bacterium]|nr:hypothetical protein [Chloroflexota bacterium]
MHYSTFNALRSAEVAFRRARPGALRLAAFGLSCLLAVGPQVQIAAAQPAPPIPTQPLTIQGAPAPDYTLRPTATPPSSGVEVVSCGGQNRIFQNCPIDGPTEIRLENQAIDAVLALHQLPAGDRDRVLAWARNDVRAALFANLIVAYKKPADQRTADEAAAVARLTQAVRQKRVDAADVAIGEYNKWAQNPCAYSPPAGFSYDRGTACARGANQLFGRPNPPSRADFQAYGAAAAYATYASDASLRALSGDTARAYGTLAGLGAAAAAGGVAAAVGAGLTVGTLTAIQPFLISTILVSGYGLGVLGSSGAALATSASAATAASSSGALGAISLGGPVAIIAAAVVIGVVQGVNVVNAAELPARLQGDLSVAQNYDPTSALASSDADTSARATQELYGAFLALTLPDYPGGGAVPAPQPSDTPLVIGGVPTRSMQYLAWDNSRHSARLSGGWWVDTDAVGNARLTLTVDYLEPSGRGWTAGRLGNQFQTTSPGGANTGLVDALTYQNWQGGAETASLPSSNAPVASARVAKGPYVSVDPGSWTLTPHASTTLQVDASAGTRNLGAWTVDVTYDPAVVQVSQCVLAAPGSCNKHFAPNTIRIEGGTTNPHVGPRTLAHLTFTAVGERGATSTLSVAAPRLNDSTGAPLTATLNPGRITIE